MHVSTDCVPACSGRSNIRTQQNAHNIGNTNSCNTHAPVEKNGSQQFARTQAQPQHNSQAAETVSPAKKCGHVSRIACGRIGNDAHIYKGHTRTLKFRAKRRALHIHNLSACLYVQGLFISRAMHERPLLQAPPNTYLHPGSAQRRKHPTTQLTGAGYFRAAFPKDFFNDDNCAEPKAGIKRTGRTSDNNHIGLCNGADFACGRSGMFAPHPGFNQADIPAVHGSEKKFPASVNLNPARTDHAADPSQFNL